jgi:hypothetical protein
VIQLRSNGLPALAGLAAIVAAGVLAVPPAHADNKRLNDSVVLDVYTVQQRAGCTSGVTSDQHLELAAKWHTRDIQTNRSLDGDVGSDGSTASDRAQTAGFHGSVAETVAINPALAISGVDILRQCTTTPLTSPSCPTAHTPKWACGRRTAWIALSWLPCTGGHLESQQGITCAAVLGVTTASIGECPHGYPPRVD